MLPFYSENFISVTNVVSTLKTGKKSEICISGISTPGKHSLPTQPKSREEMRACVYKKINFQ
jgi:hypothetical protein